MIKKSFTIFLILIILLGSNCAFAKHSRSLTQLEQREIETRIFETSDYEKVIKAAINTLQDSGFIIQEIEPDIGFIRAQKNIKRRFINKKRLAGQSFMFALLTTSAVFSYGSGASKVVDPALKIANEIHYKTAIVNANVNIEKFGKDKIKVRFVFIEKILLNADGYSYVKSAPIRILHKHNPQTYQEFFAQLDKSIFYEGI